VHKDGEPSHEVVTGSEAPWFRSKFETKGAAFLKSGAKIFGLDRINSRLAGRLPRRCNQCARLRSLNPQFTGAY
jgi:hypothetical protein